MYKKLKLFLQDIFMEHDKMILKFKEKSKVLKESKNI